MSTDPTGRLNTETYERIDASAGLILSTAESQLSLGRVGVDADVTEAISSLRAAIHQAEGSWDHHEVIDLRRAMPVVARLFQGLDG